MQRLLKYKNKIKTLKLKDLETFLKINVFYWIKYLKINKFLLNKAPFALPEGEGGNEEEETNW